MLTCLPIHPRTHPLMLGPEKTFYLTTQSCQRKSLNASTEAVRRLSPGLSEVNSCFIQSSSVFKFSFNFCYDVMLQGLQRKAEKGMIDSVYYEIRKITGGELAWQQIHLNSNTGEASALLLTVLIFPMRRSIVPGYL